MQSKGRQHINNMWLKLFKPTGLTNLLFFVGMFEFMPILNRGRTPVERYRGSRKRDEISSRTANDANRLASR